MYQHIKIPTEGKKITVNHDLSLNVPDHPIIPFITEEIWRRMTKLTTENAETIMLTQYPLVNESLINTQTEEEIDWLKKIVQSVRMIRSEIGITPSKIISLSVRNASPVSMELIQKYQKTLLVMGKISKIEYINSKEEMAVCASAVIGELELLIPIAGLIDKELELHRLERELAKLDKEIALSESKLNNPTFRDKAPAEIIRTVHEKLTQAQQARIKLHSNQLIIESL
jgi:valyl-tRNA synthetase